MKILKGGKGMKISRGKSGRKMQSARSEKKGRRAVESRKAVTQEVVFALHCTLLRNEKTVNPVLL
jgi:hypothetical protein